MNMTSLVSSRCRSGRHGALAVAFCLATLPTARANLTSSGSIATPDGGPWTQGSELAVGYSGYASMLPNDHIDGNAITTVSCGTAYVAYGAGVQASFTMNGSGSSFEWTRLWLGQGINSHGTFTMSGGARKIDPDYQNNYIYLGGSAGAYGRMIVTDPGTTLHLSDFIIVGYLTLHGTQNRFQNAPEGGIVVAPNHTAFRINYATDLGSGNLAITATVVAPPTTDADFDSLLDAWEIRCFGATDHPLGAPGLDPDGDGRNNTCEHEAGTDPLDPSSHCILTVNGTPTDATWNLAYSPYDPAVTYTVERATTLSGPWGDVTPTGSTIDGDTNLLTLVGHATGHAFYRVRIAR